MKNWKEAEVVALDFTKTAGKPNGSSCPYDPSFSTKGAGNGREHCVLYPELFCKRNEGKCNGEVPSGDTNNNSL